MKQNPSAKCKRLLVSLHCVPDAQKTWYMELQACVGHEILTS